jgi:hypothetical protein
MAVNAADAWQHSGARSDRASRTERPARPRGAVPPRRGPERRAEFHDAAPEYGRPPVPRRPERARPVPRDLDDDYAERRPRSRADDERTTRRTATPAERSRGLRGVLAVLGVFLVTLAVAGVESFLATGLGTLTMIALTASTAVAAFLVRRRDLLSVVICPPLVFTAVATVNLVAAPSVHLSGIKSFGLLMVTLLVQNFPAMGIATGVALIAGLIRLAARR